jgi:hypothetical protein
LDVAPSPPQIRSPTVALARPDTTATDRTGPRGLRPGRTPTVRLSLFIAPASSPFLKTLQHSPPPPSNLICCENHVYHSVFSRSSFAHPQSHFSLQSQTHFGFSVLPLPVFSQASLQAHFSFYFVGNLPFSVDSPQLAGLFESTRNVEMVEILILEFGFFPHFFFFFWVQDLVVCPLFFGLNFFLKILLFWQVIYDKTTGSRGFGFVTMEEARISKEYEEVTEGFFFFFFGSRR